MIPLLAALALASAPAAPDPRPPYWQQGVRYDIAASLDEARGVLAGRQRMHYANRSPDTLRTISFHLHLNAFRPGSRWSDADSVEGRRRFNDLRDPDFAFNRVRDVTIDGQPVRAEWPLAPDSTIVRFPLPRPLAPGDTAVVAMAFEARPSTLPRRQGRRGRRFDFAHWYPKVVVYDRFGWNEQPLVPAGEFYGEFATFRVTLDVPADQVVGATGVPVCGDPGWERANRQPGRAVDHGRDRYRGREGVVRAGDACAFDGGVADAAPAAGMKRLLWYAEDVHHFGLSLNPEYRYEGGRFRDVAVHVLYLPGDSASWGGGVAVRRTEVALAWLDQLFGPFAWPQLTNVHRIEGGGTEFPMMVMDGSASQGLILHEAGHNYTMGILANNEWREGWLDEGFTSFQTTWAFEALAQQDGYPGTEAAILDLDLDGLSQPTSLRSDAYRDFATYNQMIYSRGELFFHQLRYAVGDEVMRRILRTYYERWKLKHVDEGAFRAVAEEVSGRDLSTLFGQFLHSTELYDYALGRVERRAQPGGGWRTRVEVRRKAPGRIPVEVAVVGEADTAVARVEGLADREWVELDTRSRPVRVLLDPRVRTHDWNMLNNERRFAFSPLDLLVQRAPRSHSFDTFVSQPQARDRLTVGWAPVAWYNDAGGLTVGFRTREDYLGRFERNLFVPSLSTGAWSDEADLVRFDFQLRVENPVWLRAPGWRQRFEAFRVEGRYGGLLEVEKTVRRSLASASTWRHGVSLRLLGIDESRYLDPGFYDQAGVAELAVTSGVTSRASGWQLGARGQLAAGVAFAKADQPAAAALDDVYYRGLLSATARRDLGRHFAVGGRAAGAFATGATGTPAKQRQVYFQGADPVEVLWNPFLRSAGALLVRDGMNWQQPGAGAGVRALDARVSANAAAALSLELEYVPVSAPRRRLFSRVAIAAFGDAAHSFGGPAQPLTGEPLDFVADAGVGLRATHRIGETTVVTRFDVPFWLNKPAYGRGAESGDASTEFRWVVSLAPAF